MREKVGKSRNTVFPMIRGCTQLWREAHFKVKMYKTHPVQTTFGSWDVEKVHAVAARSTFRSQNVQNTPCSNHFWKLRCRKSARRCGVRSTVGRSDVLWRGRRKGLWTLLRRAKRAAFVAFPKMIAGVGHLKRICKDAFSEAGAVQETCSPEMLGGQGADFLRRGKFWSIRSSGLLR